MPIKFNLKRYKNPVFVETGTFLGEGVKRALRAGFSKIYSVEVNRTFFKDASLLFKKEIASGRVELLLGDSAVVLPKLIKAIDRNITFWLDAHLAKKKWKTQEHGEKECPLYEELCAIGKHPIKNHIIMIDDRRLWGELLWGQTVLEDEIIQLIKSINGHYGIAYERGARPDDVLVATVGGE